MLPHIMPLESFPTIDAMWAKPPPPSHRKVYPSHTPHPSPPDLTSSWCPIGPPYFLFHPPFHGTWPARNYSLHFTRSTLPWANSIPEFKKVESSKLLGEYSLIIIMTVLFSGEIWTGNQQVSTFWKLTFKIITTCMENVSNHSSKASEVITYIK